LLESRRREEVSGESQKLELRNIGSARVFNEASQKFGVLAARRGFNPTGNINTPWSELCDSMGYIPRIEASGDYQMHAAGRRGEE
jgi:hypothetical protein